jgi:CBS-domain-containing membrane protein
VRDILSRQEIVSCFEDHDIHEAAKMMEEHEVRRLPVLNRDKQLVGILSLSDLAFKTKDDHLYGEVLAHVSEPFTATVD